MSSLLIPLSFQYKHLHSNAGGDCVRIKPLFCASHRGRVFRPMSVCSVAVELPHCRRPHTTHGLLLCHLRSNVNLVDSFGSPALCQGPWILYSAPFFGVFDALRLRGTAFSGLLPLGSWVSLSRSSSVLVPCHAINPATTIAPLSLRCRSSALLSSTPKRQRAARATRRRGASPAPLSPLGLCSHCG
jgi:hypothetical protein